MKQRASPPTLAKAALIDAGAGHLGIGQDGGPLPEGGNALGHRAGREGKGAQIVKIRRGVDYRFTIGATSGSS